MNKINKKEQGFSTIEILMVIVIIGLIVTVGWFIYKNHKSTATTVKVNKTAAVSAKTSTTNSTSSTATVEKLTSWTQVPSGLQQAITKAWGPLPPSSTPQDPCPASVESTVTSQTPVLIYNNSYAMDGLGCDSGSVHLFVSISGSWQDITSTQDLLSCSTIQQYNVPIALLEADNILENAGQGNGTPVTCAQSDGSTLTLAS